MSKTLSELQLELRRAFDGLTSALHEAVMSDLKRLKQLAKRILKEK